MKLYFKPYKQKQVLVGEVTKDDYLSVMKDDLKKRGVNLDNINYIRLMAKERSTIIDFGSWFDFYKVNANIDKLQD